MALTLEDLDRRACALERAQGDTTETLRWVVAKLGRIQAVQDEHTLRLERLETKFDLMDARLGTVETRLGNVATRLEIVEGKLDALPRAIAELIEASERRLMAAIRAR
jgi:chromosome segregation ATPase